MHPIGFVLNYAIHSVIGVTLLIVVSGGPDPFFAHRISTPIGLCESGRVDYIIASGDNRHRSGMLGQSRRGSDADYR